MNIKNRGYRAGLDVAGAGVAKASHHAHADTAAQPLMGEDRLWPKLQPRPARPPAPPSVCDGTGGKWWRAAHASAKVRAVAWAAVRERGGRSPLLPHRPMGPLHHHD